MTWLRDAMSARGGEEARGNAPCSNILSSRERPTGAFGSCGTARGTSPRASSPTLSIPVLLAPMAGVNDVVFRQLCVECGADLTYTEMVSSKALSFSNDRTRRLLDLAPNERRVAVQLFGHEPDVMAREAAWVESELGDRLAYLDINMGCPARKIVKKGDGCALMKAPDTARAIVSQAVAAVSCPVTVKFRKGYGAGEDVCVDFARMMEDSGAAAVAVHGRTAAQFYTGRADWGAVARVKAAVNVPVIGNGDVASGSDAVAMVAATGCDAVMVGRAAQGNPWVFAHVRAALDGEPEPDGPTVEQRIEAARRHAHLLSERMGNNIVYMRKHAMWYLRGIPGASRARGRLNQCVTPADFDEVLDEVLAEARAHADADSGIAANAAV